VIAGWVIVTGVIELVTAIALRREIENEWMLVLGGLVSVIFRVVLAVLPGVGLLSLVWLIGLYALVGAVRVLLSGVAGFLSNLFLILMIMLFLLADGPAMMERLRSSAGEDHPRVGRLTFGGQSVVRQFGLRAVVNVATAAGVTILLFVLGVNFPLMWGVLTFI